MPVYKTYNVCAGESVYDLFPEGSLNFQNVPSIAFVIPLFNVRFGLAIIGNEVGNFSFTFDLDGEEQTIEIVISNCIQNFYDNCCDNQCNIAWLNRQGGWQNYIFTGIKTFEVRQDDGNTFKTLQKVLKWTNRSEVYDGMICTTGNIPKAHVDYLDSLRYSIQAYLYNPTTNAWDIPIVVDSESFTKYTTKDKLFDISIAFIKSKELVIQSQ
jgi:hypothetical protein